MTRHRKLALLLVPLVFGFSALAGPGSAQQAANGRFAFADTTLLRDTLGLHFDALFATADSLHITPDTLRALSIRYRYTIDRLLLVADSLGVPVDSVGPIMERESFNPLAAKVQRLTQFTYNSSYSVDQASNSWANGADYNLIRGGAFLRNNTDIVLDQFTSGRTKSFRDQRTAVTEVGWRFSPDFSLGGRNTIQRFDNTSQGAAYDEAETSNENEVSIRTRQREAPGVSSELNLFSGLLDVHNVSLDKRGFKNDLNGRLRTVRGNWLTNDFNGQITGNYAKSNPPDTSAQVSTHDLSQIFRGTLGVFPQSHASFNVNYAYRNIRIQNPASRVDILKGTFIQNVITKNKDLTGALNLRKDNDRFLTISQLFSRAENASSQSLSSQNTRDENTFSNTGRWAFRQFTLDGLFSLDHSNSDYPRRSTTGGYTEKIFTRTIDGTFTWPMSTRLLLKLNGDVSLASYRYSIIDVFPNPPVDRDQYRQSWRTDVNYVMSQRFNTGGALEVSRSDYINIPAASAAANNEVRSYDAEWRWSYRLLEGMTVTQRNQATADYSFYTIDTNDRVGLNYTTTTTINAVVTPRFSINLNHNASSQPGGQWVKLEDGLYYLRKADDNQNYGLDAHVVYTPIPGLSLTLAPQYFSNQRFGTTNGVSVPQRSGKTLNFSGGVNLNLDLGAKGHLTGDINRTYRGSGNTTYKNGVPNPSPVSETDYWNGSLQLTWNL